jgi:hypothetical protein
MYAPDSIDLLQKSGFDFQRHDEIGIAPNDFAELMITSGMVLSEDTKWVSFHRRVALQCLHLLCSPLCMQWLRLRLFGQAPHRLIPTLDRGSLL